MRGDRTLYQVVKKNLLSHEARNNKTAIIFTVALSFISSLAPISIWLATLWLRN